MTRQTFDTLVSNTLISSLLKLVPKAFRVKRKKTRSLKLQQIQNYKYMRNKHIDNLNFMSTLRVFSSLGCVILKHSTVKKEGLGITVWVRKSFISYIIDRNLAISCWTLEFFWVDIDYTFWKMDFSSMQGKWCWSINVDKAMLILFF